MRGMLVIMLTSQYCFLIALSVLLMQMAPYLTLWQNEYKCRARFLLVPLHFLYVWVLVITLVTAHTVVL